MKLLYLNAVDKRQWFGYNIDYNKILLLSIRSDVITTPDPNNTAVLNLIIALIKGKGVVFIIFIFHANFFFMQHNTAVLIVAYNNSVL